MQSLMQTAPSRRTVRRRPIKSVSDEGEIPKELPYRLPTTVMKRPLDKREQRVEPLKARDVETTQPILVLNTVQIQARGNDDDSRNPEWLIWRGSIWT